VTASWPSLPVRPPLGGVRPYYYSRHPAGAACRLSHHHLALDVLNASMIDMCWFLSQTWCQDTPSAPIHYRSMLYCFIFFHRWLRSMPNVLAVA